MLNHKLWTATVTPFDRNGEIDFLELLSLVRIQKESNNGIVVMGSTGEAMLLRDDERKKAITFLCENEPSADFVVGVPSWNLHEALDFLSFCNDLPIKGFLLTTPVYTKPGICGQSAWFETIMNRSKYPCMLYNIPGRSAVQLHFESVKNISNHPNLWAIKDCSGTIETIDKYRDSCPQAKIYCGDDDMIHLAVSKNVSGLVSVMSNALPIESNIYLDLLMRNEDCSLKTNHWLELADSLFSASNPIPIKYLLKYLGKIKNDTVRLPLHNKDFIKQKKIINDYNNLLSSISL